MLLFRVTSCFVNGWTVSGDHMPVKGVREATIEEELVRRVRAAGGIAEKTTVIGRRGFFDRIVVLPGGRVYWVELKRPRGGRLSPHQIQRHAQYRALGVEILVIKNLGDIDRLLG
jgi:hypothetical protein